MHTVIVRAVPRLLLLAAIAAGIWAVAEWTTNAAARADEVPATAETSDGLPGGVSGLTSDAMDDVVNGLIPTPAPDVPPDQDPGLAPDPAPAPEAEAEADPIADIVVDTGDVVTPTPTPEPDVPVVSEPAPQLAPNTGPIADAPAAQPAPKAPPVVTPSLPIVGPPVIAQAGPVAATVRVLAEPIRCDGRRGLERTAELAIDATREPAAEDSRPAAPQRLAGAQPPGGGDPCQPISPGPEYGSASATAGPSGQDMSNLLAGLPAGSRSPIELHAVGLARAHDAEAAGRLTLWPPGPA